MDPAGGARPAGGLEATPTSPGPGDALASFIQIPAALQDQFQWVPVGVSGVVAYVVRCGRGDAENRPL